MVLDLPFRGSLAIRKDAISGDGRWFGALGIPGGRKQIATRLFFAAALAFIATTASAWPPLALAGMLLVGYTLVRVAIVGRAWTAVYLVDRKKHRLVTSGPYSMCRNPLYFFTMLGLFGVALSAGSLTVAGSVAVWFAVYYPLVIRKEEAKLSELHGEPYLTYRRTTPAFFPRLDRLRDAAAIGVRPGRIRSNTKDYAWMIWGLAFVQAASILHQAALLPVFLKVY